MYQNTNFYISFIPTFAVFRQKSFSFAHRHTEVANFIWGLGGNLKFPSKMDFPNRLLSLSSTSDCNTTMVSLRNSRAGTCASLKRKRSTGLRQHPAPRISLWGRAQAAHERPA